MINLENKSCKVEHDMVTKLISNVSRIFSYYGARPQPSRGWTHLRIDLGQIYLFYVKYIDPCIHLYTFCV